MWYDRFIKSFWRDITALGGFPVAAILIISMFFFNTLLATKLFLSLFINSIIVIIIRTFYYRKRPKKISYTNYIQKLDASSFPSLHTARAWSFALLLAYLVPILSPLLLCVLAGFIAYSRVYLRKHDWIDVTCGAILGILTASLLIYW